MKHHFRVRKKKEEINQEELEDVTKKFVQFLIDGKNNDEFSFLSLTFGTGGGGKTALAFIMISILVRSDPTRNVALWQTPAALEEIIKKNLIKYMGEKKGKEWGNRFRTITFINQIKENDIILIDEGVINLNAKEALTNDAKKFEQYITGARHMRVIVIVNSITAGVVKAFRVSSQIKIYKLLPEEMISEFKSDFVKENFERLENLEVWESLVQASHKKFKAKGILRLLLSDHCPWYDDDISKSLATSGTADFMQDKDKQVEVMITEVVEQALDHFSDKEPKNWANIRVIRAWLRQYHYEQWRMLGTRARDILDSIKLKMLEEGWSASEIGMGDDDESSYDDTDMTEEEMEEIISDVSNDEELEGDVDTRAMGKFFYKCALDAGYAPNQAKIAQYTVTGQGLQQLAEIREINLSESYITQLRKDMQDKWFGYWTEWWWAKVLGEEPNTAMNKNIPDLITTHPSSYMGCEFEEESIFTIKFRIQSRRTATFYQNGGVNNQLEPNFTPEFRKAQELGKCYYLVYFNPRWTPDHFYIKKIDPRSDIMVTIQRPDNDSIWL